jgi:hypothetical protein
MFPFAFLINGQMADRSLKLLKTSVALRFGDVAKNQISPQD